MAGSGEILKQTLDVLRMRPPRVPFFSSVTNRYVAEPDEIRANLAAQLTTPVRWVELVERLAGEQDTVLVEVGPQQALTKLNRRILEGRGAAGIIACDNPKNAGVEQLFNVRALLECLGAYDEATAATRRVRAGRDDGPGDASRPAPATRRCDRALRRHAAAHREDAPRGRRRRQGSTAARPRRPRPSRRRRPPRRPRVRSAFAQAKNTNGEHAPARPAAPPVTVARTAPPASVPRAPPRRSQPAPIAPPHRWPPAPAPAAKAAATSSLNAADLEKFLINFVVEQTGYPPEVVELDADLEADLGIDSIKKAQLFGELAEYFDVQPTENMTLDDFPTLRHVMNFLAGAR